MSCMDRRGGLAAAASGRDARARPQPARCCTPPALQHALECTRVPPPCRPCTQARRACRATHRQRAAPLPASLVRLDERCVSHHIGAAALGLHRLEHLPSLLPLPACGAAGAAGMHRGGLDCLLGTVGRGRPPRSHHAAAAASPSGRPAASQCRSQAGGAAPPLTVRTGGDERVERDDVGGAPLSLHLLKQLRHQEGEPGGAATLQ